MSKNRGSWVMLVLAGVVMSSGVYATTMVPLDLEILTLYSDTIVAGVVLYPPQSELNQENGRTYTSINVMVDEYLKVPADRMNNHRVKIYQLGGSYNGRSTVVPGMPTFQHNERVLVFLRKQKEKDSFDVVGMMQGKYQIVKDKETGVDMVVRQRLEGYALPIERLSKTRIGLNAAKMRAQAPSATTQDESVVPRKMELEKFVRMIKAYEEPDKLDKLLVPGGQQ